MGTTSYLIAAVAGLLLVVWLLLKRRYRYWTSKGIYQLKPEMFFGNAREFLLHRQAIGDLFLQVYQQLKDKKVKHGGMYMATTPMYIPVDVEVIKRILITDFQYFNSHGMYSNESVDPLSGHLFNLEGSRWRDMRAKLTPTFTSGKMKMMFATLVESTKGLKAMMDSAVASRDDIDIKEFLARFTTDIIGSCAFGIECNSMKDPEAEFRVYGRKTFEPTWIMGLKMMMIRIFPMPFLRLIKFRVTQSDVEKFFLNVVKETVDYREKNNIFRKDFMHLLLQLKNQGKVTDDDTFNSSKTTSETPTKTTSTDKHQEQSTLTLNELAAQCFVFFLAGFETSSTTMTFVLYELAVHQEVQNKLREEIEEVLKKHGGELSYEAVMQMHYLDRVINETFRIHPPVPALPRVCTKDWTEPDSGATIEKGTQVTVSIIGIHSDPEYYPQPERFDPDRFTEEEKAKRPACTFMPFGGGPRICIGLRFGMLQSKVGLITIIRNYRITLSNKTKTPLVMQKNSFINSAQGGIWVKAEKIQNK